MQALGATAPISPHWSAVLPTAHRTSSAGVLSRFNYVALTLEPSQPATPSCECRSQIKIESHRSYHIPLGSVDNRRHCERLASNLEQCDCSKSCNRNTAWTHLIACRSDNRQRETPESLDPQKSKHQEQAQLAYSDGATVALQHQHQHLSERARQATVTKHKTLTQIR